MIDTSVIRDRFIALAPHLDERGRCLFAAAEARAVGYGGFAAVPRATSIAPCTMVVAWKNLLAPAACRPTAIAVQAAGANVGHDKPHLVSRFAGIGAPQRAQ